MRQTQEPLASSSKPATKPSNRVRRLTLVVIAIGILPFGYGILSDRLTPFTSQVCRLIW